MRLLTREDFTRPDPVRYHEFPVAADCQCRIRSLTEREKSAFENSALSQRGTAVMSKLDTMRCRLVALCVVDANGNRLLGEEDVRFLQDKDGAMIAKIYGECQKHVGFAENDMEEIVKNSERVTSGDSQ